MAAPFQTDLQTRRHFDRLRQSLAADTEQIKAVIEVRPIAIAAVEEAKQMAGKFEIKGLAQAVADAKKAISDARSAPAGVRVAVTELLSVCSDLTAQVNALTSDIKFEASQLGNGGGEAETSEQPSTTAAVSGAANG